MPEWVPICQVEGAEPIEIETEEDGTLCVSAIIAYFPGTTTLKFKPTVMISLIFGYLPDRVHIIYFLNLSSQGGTAYRGVRSKKDILMPPNGGWSAASVYVVVGGTPAEPNKRKLAQHGSELAGVNFNSENS